MKFFGYGLSVIFHSFVLLVLLVIYVDTRMFGGMTTTVAFGVSVVLALIHLVLFRGDAPQSSRFRWIREVILTTGIVNIVVCAMLGRLLMDPAWNSRAFIGFAISVTYCVAEFQLRKLLEVRGKL